MKPYVIYRKVPLSMTWSDLWSEFQDNDIFWNHYNLSNVWWPWLNHIQYTYNGIEYISSTRVSYTSCNKGAYNIPICNSHKDEKILEYRYMRRGHRQSSLQVARWLNDCRGEFLCFSKEFTEGEFRIRSICAGVIELAGARTPNFDSGCTGGGHYTSRHSISVPHVVALCLNECTYIQILSAPARPSLQSFVPHRRYKIKPPGPNLERSRRLLVNSG